MITLENVTRKKARKLIKLLERETRCEVMARLGRFDNLEFIDYALKQIEYKNKIRRLLFGTDSLVELGELWGMIKKKKSKFT